MMVTVISGSNSVIVVTIIIDVTDDDAGCLSEVSGVRISCAPRVE